MEITLNQQIYYSNHEWVPAKEIGEALLALESTIQRSVPVLEALIPGTRIFSVEMFVNELQSGSIYEDLIVKFVFGSQEELDAHIKRARQKIGMDKLMSNPNIYSAIIIAILLGALAYQLGKDKAGTPEQKATIQANHNTIINIGAGMVDMKAEDFRALIEGAVQDKAEVAQNAVAVIKPAKRDSQATIMFNGSDELGFSRDVVHAAPSYLKKNEPEEMIQDFNDMELEIRATDLDSGRKGWAVALPKYDDIRVRLQIDPIVGLDKLVHKRRIRGDVSIVFKTGKSGQQKPSLVFLRALTEPEAKKD